MGWKKITERCTRLVAPSLGPGEEIVIVGAMMIGKVSAKRQIATAVAAGVLSGGTMAAVVLPATYFAVLTNQRLILINNYKGTVGKVHSVIDRRRLRAGPLRPGVLTFSMQLMVDGTPHKVSFGRAYPARARQMAAVLAQPPGRARIG